MTKQNKPSYISHSQISLFDRCKQWYFHRYRTKDEDNDPNNEMVFGSVLHKTMETLHNLARSKPEQISPEDVQKVWDDIFFGKDPIMKRSKTGPGTPLHINLGNSFYKEGLTRMMFYAENNLTEVRNIFKSEFETDFKVGKHRIKVIVDRIDLFSDKIRVLEFKTGRKIPTREEIQDNLQMDIECLGARKAFGNQLPIQAGYYSILGEKMIIVDKDDQELQTTEAYLERVCDEILTEKEFKPRINRYCYDCPVRCETFKQFLSKHTDIEGFNAILAGDGKPISQHLLETKERIALLKKREDILKSSLEVIVLENNGEYDAGDILWKIKQVHKEGYEVKPMDYTQLVSVKKGKNNDKTAKSEV